MELTLSLLESYDGKFLDNDYGTNHAVLISPFPSTSSVTGAR